MSKSAVITARVDEGTLELVDRVAKAKGRSRAWFVANAVQRFAESEAEYLAFVQEGIDALDRGESIPHDEVMAELDEMIADFQARCAK
jgi:predicted transcriptional regulator